MQFLFRTWNHVIPLAIVKNKTLKMGDVVGVRGQKYYVNCQPGKEHKFFYCVRTVNEAEVTNSIR